MAKRSTKELVLSSPTLDEEYAKKPSCPKCGSTKLYSQTQEMAHDAAFIPVTCEDCEHSWMEVYPLVGVHGVVGFGSRLAQEYSERRVARPDRCPFCGAETTDYDKSHLDFPRIYQTVSCDNCPENWDDVYEFDRIEE